MARKRNYDEEVGGDRLVRPNTGCEIAEPKSVDLSTVVVRRGRRKTLTTLEIDIFCRVLDEGTWDMAASAIAFSPRTLRDWRSKGLEEDCDDPILREFAQKVGLVESSGQAKWALDNLREHAKDDARAAVKFAEIKAPGANTTKNVKAEVEVSAKGQSSAINWDLATAEEMEIARQYDRIVARLASLS